MRVILASSSPRREALLASLRLPFAVVPSGIEEREPRPGEDPSSYTVELAEQKAADVAGRFPSEIVIAADTVVSVGDVILLKPADTEAAAEMLRMLRGREHRVTTGVAVRCGAARHSGAVTARVQMRAFSDAELQAYVATGESLDKAGAYALQEKGGALVERVTGCRHAVIGLPLCLTSAFLERCGVRLPGEAAVCVHDPAGS